LGIIFLSPAKGKGDMARDTCICFTDLLHQPFLFIRWHLQEGQKLLQLLSP